MANGPVVCVIQARMSSERLPGKSLLDLGGSPLIEWVCRRVSLCRKVDRIIVATSNDKSDDVLASTVADLGFDVFRGSLHDVRSRFIEAALFSGATIIIRVCADNPFVDPFWLEYLISKFCACDTVDYGFNHSPLTDLRFPDGFGGEAFSLATLTECAEMFSDANSIEHVTWPIWNSKGRFVTKAFVPPFQEELMVGETKFDVDRLEDLWFLKDLVDRGVTMSASSRDILRIHSRSSPRWQSQGMER